MINGRGVLLKLAIMSPERDDVCVAKIKHLGRSTRRAAPDPFAEGCVASRHQRGSENGDFGKAHARSFQDQVGKAIRMRGGCAEGRTAASCLESDTARREANVGNLNGNSIRENPCNRWFLCMGIFVAAFPRSGKILGLVTRWKRVILVEKLE